MNASLLARSLLYVGGGALICAALFFGTAGTLDYWQAWLYLAVLFLPITFVLVYLLRRDPDLLERRLRTRETQARQQTIVRASSLIFLMAFVLPGFDRRFGWSSVSAPIVVAADLVVLLGYRLFFLVLRENSFAARTVAVETGQRVVTTGPYRVVRHPMYVAVLAMCIASPLALGSAWAVLPALLLPFVMVLRIQDEERMLEDGLLGYREYRTQTKYRLIPGIW